MEKVKAFLRKTFNLFKSDTGSMIFVVIVSMILGGMLFGGKAEPAPASPSESSKTISAPTEPAVSDTAVSDSAVVEEVIEPDAPEFTLHTGDILNVNTYTTSDGGSGLIIKAKIQSMFTTEQTIRQNYHNVCGIITDQGGDKYDEIQYWAVADMTNGKEQKVIQFTVDAQTIQDIKNENIFATQLESRLKDLWILPSLTA